MKRKAISEKTFLVIAISGIGLIVILFFMIGTFESERRPMQLFMGEISVKSSKKHPSKKEDLIENLRAMLFPEKKNSTDKENLFSFIENKVHQMLVERRQSNFKSTIRKWSNHEKAIVGLSPVPAMFKLDYDGDNLPKPVKNLELYSAGSEWESFQIIFAPFVDGIKNLKVSLKGLPEGIENVEGFQTDYVYCPKPEYKTENKTWYPDALIPLEKDSNQQFGFAISDRYRWKYSQKQPNTIWFNFFTSEDVKPGKYEIEIELNGLSEKGNFSEKTLVNLTVWNFTMPKTMHLKTAFSFSSSWLEFLKFDSKIKVTEEKNKEYYSFLLNYRLNPTSIYSDETWPPIKDWKYCIDKGANAFNINYIDHINVDSIKLLDARSDKWRTRIDSVKSGNLFSYAYMYGFDEVPTKFYNNLKETVSELRKVDNRIPFICTVKPDSALFGYINTWVPLTSNYNFKTALERESKGEDVWTYVCNYPNANGYPNFFIEYNGVDPRILFWQASKNGISGFLYYKTTAWENNTSNDYYNKNGIANYMDHDNPFIAQIKQGKRWPDIPWDGNSYMRFNGDGNLIYPGKNNSLLPSIRLINIRDGIEDYEYFYILKNYKKTAKAKGDILIMKEIDDLLISAYSLVPALNDYEKDPFKLLEIKRSAGSLIEKLSKKYDEQR